MPAGRKIWMALEHCGGWLATTNDVLLRVLSAGSMLDARERDAIAAMSSREAVLQRGDPLPLADAIFVTLEGWVCGRKVLNDGEQQICALHMEGDTPDFRRLFCSRASLEYQALTPCRIGLASIAALRYLYNGFPGVANGVCRCTAIAANISDEWIANIGRRRAINRVAHLLCELIYRVDNINGAVQKDYTIPLTQIELGEATGLSTVYVNRVLQELRRQHVLAFHGGNLVIFDRQRLADMAGFDPTYLGAPCVKDG